MSKYKSIMLSCIYVLIGLFFSSNLFAQNKIPLLDVPDKSIIDNGKSASWKITDVLSYIEKFLLQAVLPLVVVGVFLYVAYELLTAEGNEEKMKKAWKVVTYSAIGLITIALAYAIIAMASRLSLL